MERLRYEAWGESIVSSFARPKENETKEKSASNQAHFPRKTHCPAAIGRLPTDLKRAVLFLEVPLHAPLEFYLVCI